MAAITEHDVDLDALEREARAHVDELREDRARLALDALSDPDAAGELASCERRLADAEDALERVGLARLERGGRDVEACSQAERDRQTAALAAAGRLQGVRLKAAERVDRAAAEWVAAVVEYLSLSRQQVNEFRAAGRRVSAVAGWPIEASLALEMRRAGSGLRGVLERMPNIPGRHLRPLVEFVSPGQSAKK
jgi:hypothetical protein